MELAACQWDSWRKQIATIQQGGFARARNKSALDAIADANEWLRPFGMAVSYVDVQDDGASRTTYRRGVVRIVESLAA